MSDKDECVMLVNTRLLSLENPVFQTYVLAASIMVLKLMLQPWMTVVRMMKAGGGFRSPDPCLLLDLGSLSVIAMAIYALMKAL
jgi:hypothetical protein